MQRRGQNVIAREISALRGTLRALDRSLRRLGPMLASKSRMDMASKDSHRRRLRLSARRRSALKLHGRYIGYVRQLRKTEKVVIRKIREAKGVQAAIARARRLLRKVKAA